MAISKISECHLECGIEIAEIAFVWAVFELLIRYTVEIIEEKVILPPQNFRDGTILVILRYQNPLFSPWSRVWEAFKDNVW